MSKKDKKPLIPRLRFPEFQDNDSWNSKPLNDILIFTERKVKKPDTPYTRLGIRSHGKGTFLVFNELPEKNAMDYLYKVKQNDLIVNITFAWEGAIAIVTKNDEGALVSHRFPTYSFNESEAIPSFFQYLIIEKQFIYKLGVISPGGAGRNRVLNKTDFLTLKINLPKIPEQQKIADCLTSLDELITVEAGNLEAYKAHKKGLIQKLFPVEGKKVPEWRFPEFRDSGEWKVDILENVSPAIYDGTHQTPTYIESGIPFFSVENIVSGNKNKFISREDYLIATIKNKPGKGDILITRIGKIGFSVVVDWDYEFSIYVTLAVIKKSTLFNSYYLNSYFQSDRYQNELRSKSLLNAVPCKINMDELRKTEILLPPLKDEQQKIAGCLSSLEDIIIAQTHKIETLKAHKKGLMQGLFPSTNEVGE